MKTGIELIADERKDQIEKYGRTIEDDVKINNANQLTIAAAMLLANGSKPLVGKFPPRGWDSEIFKNMCEESYERRLIMAGALIAAELDRLNATKVTDEKKDA